MGESHRARDSDGQPAGPDGQPLRAGRRLTYRQARSWLKRSDAVLGIRPCGMDIQWVPDHERPELVERLRHAEGKDCNLAGDVLLYRLPDGIAVVVVEEPYSLTSRLVLAPASRVDEFADHGEVPFLTGRRAAATGITQDHAAPVPEVFARACPSGMIDRSEGSCMGVTSFVASQFAHPRGAAAPVMAALLNVVNKKVNQAAIEAARIERGDFVIDIGFGGGVGLELALRAAGDGGRVVAVDPSKEMVARAQRRFREQVDAGRLTALVGEAGSLPVDSSAAHVAYTVNTTYFWPDVRQGLVEVRRVLAPSGRVVLAVQPSVIARHERFSGLRPASPQELASIAQSAGFGEAHVVEALNDVALVIAHV